MLNLADAINSQGTFIENVSGISADNRATVAIESGTIGLTSSGEALTSITIQPVIDPPSPPPEANIISLVYDFGPDGTEFSKPVTISLKYDSSQIPAGIDESQLTLAWWDSTNKVWIVLPSILDTVKKTISTQVNHFSNYTILAPQPADFVMSGLSVIPAQVNIGVPVTISVLVTNKGGLPGSYTVKLKINGLLADSQTVSLAAGEVRTFTFTSSQDNVGTYSVEVGPLTGTFAVVLSTPVFTPLSPDQAKVSSPASLPPTANKPVSAESPSYSLMVGIITVVIIIVFIALILLRKRRKSN